MVGCARYGGGLSVVRYARGAGGLPVVGSARGGRLRVTRGDTQQRGVWRHGQSQHNPKYECSEHVSSVPREQQEGRQ